MKKLWPLLLAMMMLMSVLTALAGEASEASVEHAPVMARNALTAGCAPTDNPNLLENPSFEGQYSAYVPPDGHPDCPSGTCQTAQMAPGWTPYWRSHDPNDPDWIIRMPEWKPADPAFNDPPRVHSGETAQQYFTFSSTHEGGIFQQVPVTAGEIYCFDIWGHSWSADDSDDAYSGPFDGILLQKVGIDPTGGTDWESGEIIWSEARTQYDIYGQFAVTATASADMITVYAYSQPAYAVKHNDVYLDDASLHQVTPPINIGPLGGYLYAVGADMPRLISETLLIDYSADPGSSWTVTQDPNGTLALALSTDNGVPGDTLTFFLDTATYPVGDYTTTLLIATDPPIAPEPYPIPVRLLVWEHVFPNYFPFMIKP